MNPIYIERFICNTFFDLDEHRAFMVRKIQLSKASSSRFYPVFVPRPATAGSEPDHSE